MKRQMDAYIAENRKPLNLGSKTIDEGKRLELLGRAAQEENAPAEAIVAGDDGEILDPDAFKASLAKNAGASGDFMASMRESLDAVTSQYAAGVGKKEGEEKKKDWREDASLEGLLSSAPRELKAPPGAAMDAGARAEMEALNEQQRAHADQFDRRSGFQKPDSYGEGGGSDDDDEDDEV
jgi:hypothetical protein